MPRSSDQGSASPRGAVHVTKPRAQRVQEMLRKASDIEQRLSVPGTDSKQLNQYRIVLCETLSDLLLTDPNTAAQTDAVGRLWKSCFYARIGPTRARIQKDKRKGNNVAQQEEGLLHFLLEGITLYDFLCDKLQFKLLGMDETQETQESSTQPTTTTTTDGIVVCLHRLYVHLGDLYRYGHHLHKAEHAYGIAAKLGPGIGHAFNQLAVIHIKDNDKNAATGVYNYARALGAFEPFSTAASNLSRLFESNREFLKEQHLGSVILSNASRVFLAQFVDLAYTLFDKKNAEVDDQFYNHLGEAVSSFRQLLQNSAFGDALLCKLVVIAVFSEYNNNKKIAARTMIFEFAHCLAERVSTILQNKLKNSSSSQSVRVLLPLLLVTEYLLVEHVTSSSERYNDAVGSFWKAVVDIYNTLDSLNLQNDETDKPLAEFQMLRGFAPFSFLNDESIQTTGFLSDAEAAELFNDTTSQPTQESASMQSSSQLSTQEETARIKILRFVRFKSQLLAVPNVCESNGKLEYKCGRMDVEEDDNLDDEAGDEIVNDEAVLVDDGHTDDVLVYKQAGSGGPALLVPGALLRSRASETLLNKMSAPGSASSSIAPPKLAPAVTARSERLPFRGFPNQSTAAPVAQPVTGFALMPPPGFGSMPSSALPSLEQTLGFGSYQGPRVGESYHLFGGPSAVNTANPFAVDTMPNWGGESPMMREFDTSILGQQDSTGLDGATLLDSSLLNSLLMDESPRKATTKNPFST